MKRKTDVYTSTYRFVFELEQIMILTNIYLLSARAEQQLIFICFCAYSTERFKRKISYAYINKKRNENIEMHLEKTIVGNSIYDVVLTRVLFRVVRTEFA